MHQEVEISQEQYEHLQKRYEKLLNASKRLCKDIADWQMYRSSPSFYTAMNTSKRNLEGIIKTELQNREKNQPELNKANG